MAMSNEFRLIVECCRSCFGHANDYPIVTKERPVDWALVLRLTRFHRVQGLVAKAFSSLPGAVPKEVAADILADAKDIAAHNLISVSESERLIAAFSKAGMEVLFLKGLPLGVLAYGNAALKSAIDIDLLIDPSDLGSAAALLRAAGYSLDAPQSSSDDQILHRWHRGWKESVWAKPSPRSQIDLHTRPADNLRLIPSIDVHSRRQSVRIENVDLPTLADEELFAYLAIHGSSSAWFRLKWISDFAGFLFCKNVEELTHLFRCSQELGAGRAAGQALLLADELFATLASAPELADQLRQDPTTVSLTRTAIRLLTGGLTEPTESRFGTLPIHWTQFQLLPGLSYKMSELSRQMGRLFSRTA